MTADTSTTILNATVSADAAAVRSFVGLNLRKSDLQPGGLSADRLAALQQGLRLLTDRGGILHAALLAPDGTVLASDDGASVGKVAPVTPGLVRATPDGFMPPWLCGAMPRRSSGSSTRVATVWS